MHRKIVIDGKRRIATRMGKLYGQRRVFPDIRRTPSNSSLGCRKTLVTRNPKI